MDEVPPDKTKDVEIKMVKGCPGARALIVRRFAD